MPESPSKDANDGVRPGEITVALPDRFEAGN